MNDQDKVTLLREALKLLLEHAERPPEPNCSCHISPPCSDCVEHWALRETIKNAEWALERTNP